MAPGTTWDWLRWCQNVDVEPQIRPHSKMTMPSSPPPRPRKGIRSPIHIRSNPLLGRLSCVSGGAFASALRPDSSAVGVQIGVSAFLLATPSSTMVSQYIRTFFFSSLPLPVKRSRPFVAYDAPPPRLRSKARVSGLGSRCESAPLPPQEVGAEQADQLEYPISP